MKGSFVAGMVTGTLAGMAMGMILDPVKDKHNVCMKKKTTKAFKTLGSIIDGIIDAK